VSPARKAIYMIAQRSLTALTNRNLQRLFRSRIFRAWRDSLRDDIVTIEKTRYAGSARSHNVLSGPSTQRPVAGDRIATTIRHKQQSERTRRDKGRSCGSLDAVQIWTLRSTLYFV